MSDSSPKPKKRTGLYRNRPYDVGQLDYKLDICAAARIEDIKVHCMLEYGEQEILFDIPRILKLGGNYLNLGHAEGGSAMLMARGMAWENLAGLVHSVDTFDDYRNHFEKAVRILERRHCTDSVKLYSGKTFEFVDTFREMPLSFIFIDADHSYEGVRDDYINFSPMVVLGGAISFHDTNQEPSHRVIEENITGNPMWEQTHHVNRIKVFRRVQ